MASNSTVIICLLVVLSACLNASALLTSDPNADGILVEFLHRDHFRSPLRDPESLTLADRMAKAVRRGHERIHRLGLPLNSTFSSTFSPPVEAQVYSASGEYVMTGSLGTPPKDFVAIADTGSDLVWVQCKQCLDCLPQRDPLFDPTKSLTFKELPCSNQFCKDLQQPTCRSTCSYLYSYGDGSFTEGLLASDTTIWTATDGKAYFLDGMAFGCGLDNQGYFSRVDGVVGFGRGPLSLPSQIGSHVGRKFSYCLGNFASATNQSSSLVIGNNIKEDISRFKFTPLLRNDVFPTFYYVHLKSITVDGQRLHIHQDAFSLDSSGNGGTIVDSGTTITYLPRAAYDVLRDYLVETIAYPVVQNTTSIGLDLCFDVSGVIVPRFPTISFGFSRATLRLPVENSFIAFDLNQTSFSCLAMGATEEGTFGIIGNYQQQNFQILYDLERSSLGFKKKECYQ